MEEKTFTHNVSFENGYIVKECFEKLYEKNPIRIYDSKAAYTNPTNTLFTNYDLNPLLGIPVDFTYAGTQLFEFSVQEARWLSIAGGRKKGSISFISGKKEPESAMFETYGVIPDPKHRMEFPYDKDKLLNVIGEIPLDKKDRKFFKSKAKGSGVRINIEDLVYDIDLFLAESVDELPKIGNNWLIVALIGGSLHFRVFDDKGGIAIDKGESDLPEDSEDVAKLKEEIEAFREKRESLSASERSDFWSKYFSDDARTEMVEKAKEILGLSTYVVTIESYSKKGMGGRRRYYREDSYHEEIVKKSLSFEVEEFLVGKADRYYIQIRKDKETGQYWLFTRNQIEFKDDRGIPWHSFSFENAERIFTGYYSRKDKRIVPVELPDRAELEKKAREYFAGSDRNVIGILRCLIPLYKFSEEVFTGAEAEYANKRKFWKYIKRTFKRGESTAKGYLKVIRLLLESGREDILEMQKDALPSILKVIANAKSKKLKNKMFANIDSLDLKKAMDMAAQHEKDNPPSPKPVSQKKLKEYRNALEEAVQCIGLDINKINLESAKKLREAFLKADEGSLKDIFPEKAEEPEEVEKTAEDSPASPPSVEAAA